MSANRPGSSLLRRAQSVALVFIALGLGSTAVEAQQTSFTVDPRTSLSWWQLNPHMMHLWGTTCPQDPSWRPGEGVSMSQAGAFLKALRARTGYSTTLDTVVPLYPRRTARPLCTEAVSGQVTVEDMRTLRGVKGTLEVDAADLFTGLDMRDKFLRDVLETTRHPSIRFTIDSLAAVQPGDTIKANAHGSFTLRGVSTPMIVPVLAWQEAGGLRVTGDFEMVATDMTDVYGISKYKLGLGVGQALWKFLHMGIDVVLKEES